MVKVLMNNVKTDKTTVYTPESPILHPVLLLKAMLADLRSSFPLAYRLTARDISGTYRQTALGYFWAIFPPLFTSLTFIILNKANVIRVQDISVPYPVFVITGTVFWQLFIDALNAPLKVLNLNRNMLSKINFPKEALIISGICQVLFSFAIKLVLLACVLVLFGTQVKWTLWLLLFPVMGLLTIGTLAGVFLVPIGMLYQDIQQGLTICTSALIFFTPVLYPVPSGGMLEKIIEYNPIAPLLMLCREMLFLGQLDSMHKTATIFAATLMLVFVGWIVYRIALPNLIERMEA
jgi:lipopolysaccharide transport system permease protein